MTEGLLYRKLAPPAQYVHHFGMNRAEAIDEAMARIQMVMMGRKILDEAKKEFYDVMHDYPFPTKERNDKLVELIKKWFG